MSDQPARSEASKVLRILVVDDNDDNRNLLSRRLRSKGYEVDIAEDGPLALEACAKVAYDAILLDVMMPGMSGIEVLEKLRQKYGKTELSVIMATAKNDSTSVVDALKRGANDYVTKPIDFPVLLARLETQLAMKAEAAERATAQVDVTFGIAPGTVLGDRYEILDKRGEGGFAVVYRARQLSTNRDVALKHLRPDVLGAPGDTVQLERFERESKLIGELNHPNVVRLIDSGSISVRRVSAAPKRDEASGGPTREERAPISTSSQTRRRPPEQENLSVPYIVMELLTGESLGDLIDREAPLEAGRSIDLTLPVLSALAAAHEKGVVHRDIKPSNIMLTRDDRGEIEPKVLDFGIAKLTACDASDLTVSASLIGTPQYMPPEQAFGKKDLDGRVDQFSAAAVLYHMLTGRSLFAGESLFELVSKVLAGEYIALEVARPDLPQGLVDVIARALSTEREHRHPSITAFGAALLPFATERAARRWSDHFTIDPTSTAPTVDVPRESDAAVVSIERSERAVGPTDPTLQVVGVEPPRKSVPPKPLVILGPDVAEVAAVTLESEVLVTPTPSATPPVSAGPASTPAPASTPPRAAEPTASTAPASVAPPLPPPVSLGQPIAKMPWERLALIVIAVAALFYVLSRYVF